MSKGGGGGRDRSRSRWRWREWITSVKKKKFRRRKKASKSLEGGKRKKEKRKLQYKRRREKSGRVSQERRYDDDTRSSPAHSLDFIHSLAHGSFLGRTSDEQQRFDVVRVRLVVFVAVNPLWRRRAAQEKLKMRSERMKSIPEELCQQQTYGDKKQRFGRKIWPSKSKRNIWNSVHSNSKLTLSPFLLLSISLI